MAFWKWDKVSASYGMGGEIRSLMSLVNIAAIQATKLYEGSLTSLAVCMSQCLQAKTCYYMTVNKKYQLCTFYSYGSTTIDVTQQETYVIMTKTTNVIYVQNMHQLDLIHFTLLA